MINHFPSFRQITLIGCAFTIIIVGTLIVYAQSSGCPTPDFYPKWPHCITVYYSFANITDAEEQRQINQAIANWNNANQFINNSKVTFALGPGPWGATTLTFRNGYADGGAASFIDNTYFGDALHDATINIEAVS